MHMQMQMQMQMHMQMECAVDDVSLTALSASCVPIAMVQQSCSEVMHGVLWYHGVYVLLLHNSCPCVVRAMLIRTTLC